MRVDPSGSPQTSVNVSQTDAAAARGAAQPAAPAATAASPSDPGTFAMTQQLTQLLAAVRATPDVRAEAVTSATAKLASGELDTPQAAAETAGAMLSDAVPPPTQ